MGADTNPASEFEREMWQCIPYAWRDDEIAKRCVKVAAELAERAAVERIQEAQAGRCPSCEHTADFHQPEGCWYTVVRGKPGSNLVCPCEVGRHELEGLGS